MAQDMCLSSSTDEEATESDLSCGLPAREGTAECTPARTQPGSRISAHSVFKERESQAAANKGDARTLNSSPELEVTQRGGGAAADFGRAFHHTSPGVHAETERDQPVHELTPELPQRTPGVITPQPSLWLPSAASMHASSPQRQGAAVSAGAPMDVLPEQAQRPNAERCLLRACSQRSCVTTSAQAEGQSAPTASGGDGRQPGGVAPAAGARSGNLVRPVPRNPEEVVAGILGAIRQQRAALAASRQQSQQAVGEGTPWVCGSGGCSSFTRQIFDGSSAVAQQARQHRGFREGSRRLSALLTSVSQGLQHSHSSGIGGRPGAEGTTPSAGTGHAFTPPRSPLARAAATGGAAQGAPVDKAPDEALQQPIKLEGLQASNPSSRSIFTTNSVPIDNPELRRILTGDLSWQHPLHFSAGSQAVSPTVRFPGAGVSLPNPFAGFGQSVDLAACSGAGGGAAAPVQALAAGVAAGPPIDWGAAFKAATRGSVLPPPPPSRKAEEGDDSDTESKSNEGAGEAGSGGGLLSAARLGSSAKSIKSLAARGRRRAVDDVLEEQCAESLPPAKAPVRRALAGTLEGSASAAQTTASGQLLAAASKLDSVLRSSSLQSDEARHLVEAAFQGQDSLPLLRSLRTSLLRRDSSLGSTTTARFGAQHAAADPSLQATGNVMADVQRILQRARQIPAPGAKFGMTAAAAAAAGAETMDHGPGDDDMDAEEPIQERGARKAAAEETPEERLHKRRQSNRESARRTRQRRSNEIHGLREANEALCAANEALTQQVADLQSANRMLLASLPAIGEQHREMAAENSTLKAELQALRSAVAQHLAAQAQTLQCAQAAMSSQGGAAAPQAPAVHARPHAGNGNQ